MPVQLAEYLGDGVLVDDLEQVDALGPPRSFSIAFLAALALLDLLRQPPWHAGASSLRLRPPPRRSRCASVGEAPPRAGGSPAERAHPADPQPAAGLVDQVNRLVREEAVGDIAVG